MRKTVSILLMAVTATLASFLAGCGSSPAKSTGSGGNGPLLLAPVSLSITDDPPAGVSVLFFQVSLTSATMQPASAGGTPVTLVGNPIVVDVTQLQALSAFLNMNGVQPGAYSSLTLTFANPQLIIYNSSDASLAPSCAIGSVCQLTPPIDNSATITLNSSPFPVTFQTDMPAGLLVDFHLNTIIQPDLSVNLGAANGLSVAEFSPSAAPTAPPLFGGVTGMVGTVDAQGSQFELQMPNGNSLMVLASTSTTYNDFPTSACSSAGFACIAQGQIVQVQVSNIVGQGYIDAAQISYVAYPGEQSVVGTIVDIPPLPTPAGETIVDMILHPGPSFSTTSLPAGGFAQVAVWSPTQGSSTATTFSIDSDGFTIPSGLTFASNNDLAVGQTVTATMVTGSLQTGPVSGPVTQNGWGPPVHLSFTASSLALEPSQITGTIASVGTGSFTLNSFPVFFVGPTAVGQPLQSIVETTSQTTYTGFTPDDFSGLADNDLVSVNGWLFPQNGVLDPAIGPPIVVAKTVTSHPGALF
jgi:hypothetical protein